MSPLRLRRLGRTNLLASELGLGAMDTPQSDQGEETLHLALDLGINFIDTARIYQGSEYLIGRVIRAREDKAFHIASKTINRTRDGAQYDVDRSLRILGLDSITLYQLDDVSTLEDWQAVMGEAGALAGLQAAKERGLIRHIGMSSHNLEVLERAITSDEFDTVMLEYSAFFRDMERLIALANQRDVGVIVMRPLGGSGRMSFLRTKMASESEVTLTPAKLLTYVLSNPGVSVAIAGVRYPSRVRENVETASTYVPLDPAAKREVEREAEQLF